MHDLAFLHHFLPDKKKDFWKTVKILIYGPSHPNIKELPSCLRTDSNPKGKIQENFWREPNK